MYPHQKNIPPLHIEALILDQTHKSLLLQRQIPLKTNEKHSTTYQIYFGPADLFLLSPVRLLFISEYVSTQSL